MAKIKYKDINFRADALNIIGQANTIIGEYAAQGFDLTLRQLYYQFVARDILKNTTQSYKKLGGIINDGRLAGLIDWERIEDRTRGVETIASWPGPRSIVSACASQFQLDLWEDQDFRVEVWIEKEALAGVFERICQELRVPHLSCRGYTSQSEMWRAGRRLLGYVREGKTPLVLHFGDHDPSGIDMSRDITDRLNLFTRGEEVDFKRLALNMDQVEEYNPPPNPAKATDSRFEGYVREFGDESWELDALDPTVLAGLVREAVLAVRYEDRWEVKVEEENECRRLLGVVASRWEEITGGF